MLIQEKQLVISLKALYTIVKMEIKENRIDVNSNEPHWTISLSEKENNRV